MTEFDFISVVGEAVDGQEALEKIKKLSPEVVLMDLNMPNMSGLEATPIVRERFPDIKVIALTMHDNSEYIAEILRAGAHGYILKDATPEQLARAIQCVMDGITFFSPPVSQVVVQKYLQNSNVEKRKSKITLTEREEQVLMLLATGKTSKQIASKLGIGTRTAETFRSLLMRKFKVSNTAALIKSATDTGLLV